MIRQLQAVIRCKKMFLFFNARSSEESFEICKMCKIAQSGGTLELNKTIKVLTSHSWSLYGSSGTLKYKYLPTWPPLVASLVAKVDKSKSACPSEYRCDGNSSRVWDEGQGWSHAAAV